MPQYVIANRRAGRRNIEQQRASMESLGTVLHTFSDGIQINSDAAPDSDAGRRILSIETELEDAQQMALAMGPDVIMEPVVYYYLDHGVQSPFGQEFESVPLASNVDVGEGKTIRLTVKGSGNKLEGAKVTLYLQGVGGIRQKVSSVTSKAGRVSFNYSNLWQPIAVVASPVNGYWSTVVHGPVSGSVVDCAPLPNAGPLGWWHNSMGVDEYDVNLGAGIRVGVIDSGVGPNPGLAHVTDLGAIIGDRMPDGGADSGMHGSHVSGTIGARPNRTRAYAGIAPGCDLFSVRVFPSDGRAASPDIISAIELLSEDNQCDLINMSLGGGPYSELVDDSILYAYENGTVCVCAAGNNAGRVNYPAAYDSSLAVSALGRLGQVPSSSTSYMNIPSAQDRFGENGIYLATFSCFGSNIDYSAPGVGIVATVPDQYSNVGSYVAMDGTSMASPLVTGAGAAILSTDQTYLQMPRNEARAEMAKRLIRDSSVQTGLATNYQGTGIPAVT